MKWMVFDQQERRGVDNHGCVLRTTKVLLACCYAGSVCHVADLVLRHNLGLQDSLIEATQDETERYSPAAAKHARRATVISIVKHSSGL
jgi:hypothetical protein